MVVPLPKYLGILFRSSGLLLLANLADYTTEHDSTAY